MTVIVNVKDDVVQAAKKSARGAGVLPAEGGLPRPLLKSHAQVPTRALATGAS